MGAAGVVQQEIMGVDSSLVVDIQGGMARRVGKDMFPITNWRGHINTHWASGVLACKPFPQAARKNWQLFSSSSMASLSKCCMLSL